MDEYFFSSRPAFPWSVETFGLPALAAVAALLVVFTVWTYLGHPQATRRRVLIVLCLRLAALLLTLLTAIRPSVGVNENPKQPSTLLVGVDVSESMTTKDEIGGQSRADAVRKTLEKCQPVFDEMLTERGVNVVLYKFGPPDFNEATSRYEPGAPANAKRSDYGAYLNRTFERWQSEQRVRGHVVIGDGIDNGEKYSATSEAGRFGRRGVPLHTFLVGQEGSNTTAKDIAVAAVECDPSPAFIKNKVAVTARVNAYGFVGARVTARVFINDEPKYREDFTLEALKNELKLRDIETPEEKGEYKVRVEVGIDKDGKIEALPGELDAANNRLETYLTVLKEGVRILIVDQLRWEETFLRDALRGEPRFDVYEVILQADFAPTEGAKALLNLDEQAYDVVVIGNAGAAQLSRAAPDFLDKLAGQAAKKGVGVMFLGGEFAYQGIPDKLLPLAGGGIVDKLDARGNPTATYPAIPTARGIEKMFRVTGKPGEVPKAGESEELWNRMNNFRTGIRLNGYNRLALTDKQRALYTVFAWTTDAGDPNLIKAGGEMKGGQELLVGSQRGDASKGRWLAFGAFDTYLWRSLGQPKADDGVQMHERFWRQCALWLAHQDEEESRVYARPQYRQLKVTQEQTVRVGVKRPDGSDDPDAKLEVRIVPVPPGQTEPRPEDEAKAPTQTILTDVDRSTGQPFRKVLFRAPAPGEYFVAVTAPGKGPDGQPTALRGTAKFIAIPDTSDEMLRVNPDQDFMQRLSVPTGGKALRLEDLPGFLRELKSQSPPDVGLKPRYYPDWHRNRSQGFLPLWLVLFALLLGAEWGLRRLWGMV